MARIRTIKPEFWKDEELSELPELTHMFAAALLNYADDEGYFNANPALIKAELFPLREPSLDIHVMLSELSRIGYLRLCKGPKGKTFGHVVNFSVHQRVNRPTASKIKELIEITDDSVSTQEPLIAGKERKGKEQGTGNNADESAPECEKPNITKTDLKKACPDIDPSLIDQWFAVRKDKKANTLTKRAWDKFVVEAAKAGITIQRALEICVDNHWRGFESSWLKSNQTDHRGQSQPPQMRNIKPMPIPGRD